MDYTYNIRNWLTAINNPNSLGSDHFGMALGYTTGEINNEQYNGNILSLTKAGMGEATSMAKLTTSPTPTTATSLKVLMIFLTPLTRQMDLQTTDRSKKPNTPTTKMAT